jgi:hypothetical protein
MLKKSIVLSRDLYGKQRMFTCSAGDSQFAIAPDGIHPCHRTFTFTVNEIRKYEKCDVEFVYKHMVANEDLEISRLSYVMGAFHNNLRFRQNSAIVSIYEAARTGEILPKYKNYDDAYLLAIMCTNVVSCHMDNFILNSAVGVIPISMLRFFGNGAADIILESVLEDIKNGR